MTLQRKLIKRTQLFWRHQTYYQKRVPLWKPILSIKSCQKSISKANYQMKTKKRVKDFCHLSLRISMKSPKMLLKNQKLSPISPQKTYTFQIKCLRQKDYQRLQLLQSRILNKRLEVAITMIKTNYGMWTKRKVSISIIKYLI